jgi:hypothetical protein
MGALNRGAPRLAGRVIGVYGSGGAPWHHLALAAVHGGEPRVVRAEDVAAGRLDELDAIVFPGGGATAMAGLLAPLGEAGSARIRTWVEGGGSYVSSCAGSVLPLALADAADAALPTARCLRMVEVPLANPGDATLGGLSSPGVGRIAVRVDPEHPYAAGLPETVELVHYNGPLFDMRHAPADVRAFAWPLAATDAFTPAERFLAGTGRDATEPDTVLSRCVAAGAATALEAPVGSGRAVLFGSHPEFGLGPLLLGWGAGTDLLVEALAAGEPRGRDAGTEREPRRGGRDAGLGWATRPEHVGVPAPGLAARACDVLTRVAERFAAISDLDVGDWLKPGYAATFHGRDAATAWAGDTRAAAEVAETAARELRALASDLGRGDLPWLDDQPRPDQDFGALGLLQLSERIEVMLTAAERAAAGPPRRPSHAYDLFESHPFHLAVGSYLSAAGLTAAALLTVAVLAARRGGPSPALSALLWADATPATAAVNSSSEGAS